MRLTVLKARSLKRGSLGYSQGQQGSFFPETREEGLLLGFSSI